MHVDAASSEETREAGADNSLGSALGPDWHDGLHMQGAMSVGAPLHYTA